MRYKLYCDVGKYNQDLHLRFKGVFENLTSDSLTQKIQDWIQHLKIDFSLIEQKIDFDEFIKIYYLEDNKSMRGMIEKLAGVPEYKRYRIFGKTL